MPGPDPARERRFDEIFGRHLPTISSYCRWRSRSATDAENAVSEVFLTLWRRLDDVGETDAVRVWLYATARRVTANHLRASRRRPRAHASRTPAGLRVRALAFAFDYVVMAAYLAVLVAVGAIVSRMAHPIANALFGNPVSGQASGFLLITVPVTLYFALSEASPRRATWGKRRAGLQVTDLEGRRLSRVRSLGRTVLKFVPWELAHWCIWQISFAADPSSPVYTVGFAVVWLAVGANVFSLLVSSARQTLYDRLARTLVVRGS